MLMEKPGGSFMLSSGNSDALYTGGTINSSVRTIQVTLLIIPPAWSDATIGAGMLHRKNCWYVHRSVKEQLIGLPVASEEITTEEIRGSDIQRIIRESQVVQRVLQVWAVISLDIFDHLLPRVVRRLHGKGDLARITLSQLLHRRTAILLEDKPEATGRLVRGAGLHFGCPHHISIAQAFEVSHVLVHETRQLLKPL